jgi:6-phosphogluconolactonase
MVTSGTRSRQARLLLVGLLLLLGALAWGVSSASADTVKYGAAFVLTNESSGNGVAVFYRNFTGRLVPGRVFSTGGQGSGGGLGSQGALALSQDNRRLFAVNAGSNDISSFIVLRDGLLFAGRVPSGGEMPVSVAVHDNLVYVLNAGGSGNISGFTLTRSGKLSPLEGSTRPLSNGGSGAAPGPAQVLFNPAGDRLVVIEKASNLIDVYTVGEDGLPSGPQIYPSSGTTPFGSGFNRQGYLLVSEAAGAQSGQASLSSYALTADGLSTVTPSLGNSQTAACWLAVARNGRLAYTINTPSGTLSAYFVAGNGRLSLLDPVAGTAGEGSQPIDAAFSTDSFYVYVVDSGLHTVQVFQKRGGNDGSLILLGNAGTLPASAVGIAAY